MRPGTELGFLYTIFENTSDAPIFIRSVVIRGPGIGTVVRPVLIRMAPLRSGYHHYDVDNATAGGLYLTDPPVLLEGKGCHRQSLRDVSGFRMSPGSYTRVFLVIRAIRPGRFAIPYHVIVYSMNGTEYRQTLPTRFTGVVSNAAHLTPVPYQQADCVGPAHARYLAGYGSRRKT